MKITNTQKGPRGVNTVNGPVLVEPGQTVDVKVHQREREHLEASGWFEISGKYEPNPDQAAAPPMNDDALAAKDAEIAELKRQLAEATSPASDEGSPDREALKAKAMELGLDFAKNIPTDKLAEMIDAKLKEQK